MWIQGIDISEIESAMQYGGRIKLGLYETALIISWIYI